MDGRRLRIAWCGVLAAVALAGCGKRTDPENASGPAVSAGSATLVLRLPEYNEYPDRRRLARLTIDGKAWEGSLRPRTRVPVDLEEGKEKVKVTFSFWPRSYSNTIRTRVVEARAGEEVEVDLRQEGPSQPDRIEAIFFESAESLQEEIVKLADVGPGDVVCDIGCGDGRLVLTAVKKFKARKGIGYDIRPELVELCRENAAKAGVADHTEFVVQDALKLEDLSGVSVVLLYLGEDLSSKLQPLLQKTLRPGSRVVSLDFRIGDWKPDVTKVVKATNNYGAEQAFTLYLWRVK